MYTESEILYPFKDSRRLRNARGKTWRQLIDRIVGLPEDHPESLAFALTMIRLDGCLRCETDCFRAMHGCVACSLQALRRFRGSDADLMANFNRALADVCDYLQLCSHHPGMKPKALPAWAA